MSCWSLYLNKFSYTSKLVFEIPYVYMIPASQYFSITIPHGCLHQIIKLHFSYFRIFKSQSFFLCLSLLLSSVICNLTETKWLLLLDTLSCDRINLVVWWIIMTGFNKVKIINCTYTIRSILPTLRPWVLITTGQAYWDLNIPFYNQRKHRYIPSQIHYYP